MKTVFWFCLFLFIGASCLDQPDCFRQDVNLVGIYFKKIYDGKADTVELYSASTTQGDSTFVFWSKTRVTSISMPLNYLKNSTTFAIQQVVRGFLDSATVLNTITVGHKSKIQFVSEDCGERFVVSNLELSQSTYDSIALVSNTPSNPAHMNIAIYRCPRTNLVRLNFRQLFMDETDVLSRGKLDARPITSISNGLVTLSGPETVSTVLLPLPLDLNVDSTIYDFRFVDGDTNSVTLHYKVDTRSIVTMCGNQNVYSKLTTATKTPKKTDFKILKVVRDELTDPPVTNIEVFRCPVPNQIRILLKQGKGTSRADTLNVTSLTADFLQNAIYTDSAASFFTLPLNPDTNSTTFTFNVKGEAQSTLTLQLDYLRTPFTTHDVCPGLKTITGIKLNAAGTSFYDADFTILDAGAKFPAVNNIEITRK